MKLSINVYDLPLRDPFTISRESITVQRSLIVELEHDGWVGRGEATVNRFYGASVESMMQGLHQVEDQLAALLPADPRTLWLQLDPLLGQNRFAQCALDCAAWDLWGQLQDKPVWELLGCSLDQRPPSCYTIGIDQPDVMVRKLNEMPGWPVYKIKVGTADDLRNLELLRQHTHAPFRVDANCGWTVDQVLPMAEKLQAMNVELIEQPLAPEKNACMSELKSQSPLVLMADESCEEESDVEKCLHGFHAINIKLVKCGGLTPAFRMIQVARKNGLKVMVGCMTESSIGISAAAQLLPLLDYADMDGAVLLREDIADGVRFEKGQSHYPNRPGLGIILRPTSNRLLVA